MVGRLYTGSMQLLISVRNRDEAQSAVVGGADIIDAKEPSAGALGAVSLATFKAVVEAVGARRPVTAALGEADAALAVEARAFAFARAGATFVKIGFASIDSDERVAVMIASAASGAAAAGAAMVAVAYADHDRMRCLSPEAIAVAAARAGARGVLLDTGAKEGGGLLQLMSADRLREWVRAVHGGGMFATLAGQLREEDLPVARACGADIAGVRGAACDHGRTGTISAGKVRVLAEVLRDQRRDMPSTEVVAATRS